MIGPANLIHMDLTGTIGKHMSIVLGTFGTIIA